ncbi:MAG: hypothetical protein IJ518_00100 [Clostridia bacterium]|nr:hypothetical protein [Clostridia bacterium]
MEGIMLVMLMAVVVEALVEYGKSIGKAFLEGSVKTAVTQVVAILAGILLCLACGGNLFAVVGVDFVWPWLGTALTGVFISRGANYISDFISKLKRGGEENG